MGRNCIGHNYIGIPDILGGESIWRRVIHTRHNQFLWVLSADIVMANIITYISMAYRVMAYTVMAYIVMAYIVMAFTVMVYIGMAYIVAWV